ncbi:MAG: hypothetical protein HFJ25_03425 [Clostridia bacterium]|nr:hypothetical protein [Clostridia bacterium]
MKELEGIWWTVNTNKILGKLVITDENKIYLTTYEKLYDANVICGFAGGEKITLVDVVLDRTDIYSDEIYDDESNKEDTQLKYNVYTYVADIAIFGHVYERKGDIRLKEVSLYYTNLDQWVDWKVDMPEISTEEESILLKIDKFKEKTVKTEKFDLKIRNPYMIKKLLYNLEINNQIEIVIKDIKNEYIQTVQGIVQCLQFFLILCMGDNINVEKIKAFDLFDREIEIIIGYGKNNYENRSILKNIINYKDVENDFDNILSKWMKVYEENELLMINFVKLQTSEDILVSEYMNLMSAIDSLHLLVTNKEQSKESCAEIVKKLLKETNFILKFSEEEIEELAKKVKNIRRYFVHSNKTQKQIVHSNILIIKSIITILIEVIRSRIMLEIGIEQKTLEEYYKSIKELEAVKYDIVNNINQDKEVISEKAIEGGRVMNSLSKKDKENIAELNALLGTKYRENELDLENSNDLIEAIENSTAEYMDYINYWGELSDIIGNFDQSLEVFHPEKWFNMVKEKTTESKLIDETISSLYDASDNMSELADISEERCKKIWKFMLLGNNKIVQEYFIGDISKYKEKELIEAIENTIENIFEVKYENQVQNDTRNFADEIKSYLENSGEKL